VFPSPVPRLWCIPMYLRMYAYHGVCIMPDTTACVRQQDQQLFTSRSGMYVPVEPLSELALLVHAWHLCWWTAAGLVHGHVLSLGFRETSGVLGSHRVLGYSANSRPIGHSVMKQESTQQESRATHKYVYPCCLAHNVNCLSLPATCVPHPGGQP
jgi:hypothetical protein